MRAAASNRTASEAVVDRDTLDNTSRRTTALIVGAACAAAALAFILGRNGSLVSPDGTVYTSIAHNIATGKGLTAPLTVYTDHLTPAASIATHGQVPLTRWPPLFPLALALFEIVGITANSAAVFLNASLLGVNVYLVGVLTRRLFPNLWGPLLATTLTVLLVRDADLISFPLLLLHTTTLSEPLFIALTLATILLLDHHIVSHNPRYLLFAAITASLAVSTRFVGLAVVATVTLVALCVRNSIRQRFLRAAGCATIGIAPSLALVAGVGGGSKMQPFSQMSATMSDLRDGLAQLVAPLDAPMWIRTAATAALLLAAAASVITATKDRAYRQRLRRLLPAAATAALIVAQLITTRLLVDRNVSLIGRQLAVVQILGLVAVLGVLSASARTSPGRGIATAAACGLVALSVTFGGTQLVESLQRGIPHPAAPDISETLAATPKDTTIFSNVPDLVYRTTGRTAYLVPCRSDYYTGELLPDFQAELNQLTQLVAARKAVVVLVGNQLGRPSECASELDLEQFNTLRLIHRRDHITLVGPN